MRKHCKKTNLSDRLNNACESILGVPTDLIIGLHPLAIVANRLLIAGIGFVTGGVYGRYRDSVYKKMVVKSTFKEKYGCELAVFNTFQVPIYIGSTFLTFSLFNGFDSNSIRIALQGGAILIGLSIGAAYLKGLYVDYFRKELFKVPTAFEKVKKFKEKVKEKVHIS